MIVTTLLGSDVSIFVSNVRVAFVTAPTSSVWPSLGALNCTAGLSTTFFDAASWNCLSRNPPFAKASLTDRWRQSSWPVMRSKSSGSSFVSNDVQAVLAWPR